ncbi:Gfo/Idh/MocA family protein [Bacillus sp. Marseille-P3661]|uniref:Gfo/Idh/MocA family protein n=1 Tax=Bacillus sp. Marseille-P3661 TaxID=1936234 RepID=UPI0021554EFF|nr:Gfo/Idh/MocA family oxidoreductase [Bacillus sp. Marseille-P3661]
MLIIVRNRKIVFKKPISTAHIGKSTVIPAIDRASNAAVTAIASRDDKAIKVAEKLNIPKAYTSYETLLEDAVYIPLPNHLHKEWGVKAARKGKHVLWEKPAALNAQEVEDMIAVCKLENVKFMETFMYQFHQQHAVVRELIAAGGIGQVKLMRASFSFFLEKSNSTNIRLNNKMGGGSIYDVGSYCIHSIRSILQAEPLCVHVHAHVDPAYNVDTSAVGYLQFENGVNAMFDCSFDMAFRHKYELIGTKGKIIVPRAFRPDVNSGVGQVLLQQGNEVRMLEVITDQYRAQIEHISQAIIDDSQPSYSGEDTYKNMKVLDACYKSLACQSNVAI